MIWKLVATGNRVLAATKNTISLRWSMCDLKRSGPGFAAGWPSETNFRDQYGAVSGTVVGVGSRKGHNGKDTVVTIKLNGSGAVWAFPAYALRKLDAADD